MARVKGKMDKLDTDYQRMKEISHAGGGLFKFTKAVLGYCFVAREIKPKREKVALLEKNFQLSKRELEKIQKELTNIESQLQALNKQFEEAMAEKRALEEEAEIMQRRLTAASKLISGLSSEKVRWQDDLEELKRKRTQLLGDCLLSSGFLSYVGAFSSDFRHHMLQENWESDVIGRKIPLSQPYKLEELLTNDVEISRLGGREREIERQREREIQRNRQDVLACKHILCSLNPQACSLRQCSIHVYKELAFNA